MKAVVDTNVIAYLLVGTAAFADESRACFERLVTPLAPAHWEAELANVVWMAVKAGVVSAADAPVRLGLARRLGIESIATSTLSQGALLRAIESGVSVYDTLFVELAARSACPLVTFDKAVLKAFPDIACRPRDLAHR
ncbi:MAG: type II toxin-antitoxin system VapC family toxin [Vicinamibacterales bacterium]